MADVRALLAKERQSRRVTHPYAAYSKSGVLSCTACTLNIKSETLWEGHLKSANHRKNAQRVSEAPQPPQVPKSLKRKIEDVDESAPEVQDYEVDNRKKSRSLGSEVTQQQQQQQKRKSSEVNDEDDNDGKKKITNPRSSPTRHVKFAIPEETEDVDAVVQDIPEQAPSRSLRSDTNTVVSEQPAVDEDEWAAFERDVAPLTQVDYSAATISAAPVSAEQLAAEAEAERRKLKDTEAEDEKEDEGRRIEEEFDVMEEMEERVRKLREKREALRLMHGDHSDTMDGQPPDQILDEDPDNDEAMDKNKKGGEEAAHDDDNEDDEDEDEDEDEDDWYS